MIVKLIEKKEIAEGTMSFAFEKPKDYIFKAGQNIDLTLINPSETDNEGNSRTFSIVSAPSENMIEIATRMRDTSFKRILKDMPIGGEVEMTEAMGSFTLHNDTSKPAIFLIGGIGITPVRSILVDAAEKKLSHKLFLFYSNRRPEDAAFLDELASLQTTNPNFKLIGTMTYMGNSNQQWQGERGYINGDMIKKYVTELNAVWYISGPAAMVKTMREILTQLNVDDDFVKTEEFSGY